MHEKSNAGRAGLSTPEQSPQDPFGAFKQDAYRLKAVESRHEAAAVIAKARAWESIGRFAILALLLGAVYIFAMALGVPPPWELALSLLAGKAPSH